MTETNPTGALDDARQRIDSIDREMARLFAERMDVVADVAAYKAARGLPVHDPQREAQVLAKNAERVAEDLRPYYLRFQESVMRESRLRQRKLIEGVHVAYAGVEGAFAWVAASRAFPGSHLHPYPDFKHAYDAVERGECDCAVLPLENSEAGEVGQVMDLMFNGPLHANRAFQVPVVQNVLGLPGASLEGVKVVASHPQALAQCADYIDRHGWETRNASNTAVAAVSVIEGGDPSVAAIASAEAAELYGLEVLDHDVNESADNTTRFAVFSPAQVGGSTESFILMFTVKNEAGALARAINVVGAHGFNMNALRSRPMRSLAWRYYFYIEAEGDVGSPAGVAMLDELARECDRLKVVGRFSAQDPLDQGAPR